MAEQLYNSGMEYLQTGNFMEAETAFKTLIEQHPQSRFAVASLHQLFSLESLLGNNFSELKAYYQETGFVVGDSVLYDVADFLSNRCDIKMENWQNAIGWYENRILNPPSFQDSIFAVIDLSALFLIANSEEDSIGLKSGNMMHTSFSELIPKSSAAFAEHKAELLALLPKIDKAEEPFAFSKEQKGALLQNTPNPAYGTTIIRYGLSVDGQAAIVLYNLLGEAVKTIVLGKRTAGSYQTEVALSELAPGSYLYTLFVDGERTDTKKMIVR